MADTPPSPTESFIGVYIYFSGCFDEAREGCGCFQDNKGFSANWSREVGYCCKNATIYHTAVRCKSNGQKRRMADTLPSPIESLIGVYIYFSGCFDEVREGCGCFQDNMGFSANWSREVGYCYKNATTNLTAVRCRSNG